MIQNLEGEFRDWWNIPEEENWPTEKDLSEDQNYMELKNQLKTNIRKLHICLKQSI